MFFSFASAPEIEDIPALFRRCAKLWRLGKYRRYPVAWLALADKLDAIADQLTQEIKELKKAEPKASRPPRVTLY